MTKLKLTLLYFILAAFRLDAAAVSGASLTGTVHDPQGRAVPGAKLTLFSASGTAGSTTTSDSQGAYRFEGLPEGVYLLRAEAPGFAPSLAEDLHLAAGAPAARDIALELAGLRQQVVVTASSTPQAPEHVSKTVSTVSQAEADTRDTGFLTDAVALAPGLRVVQLGGPGAYTSIRTRGLRDEDTAVLIDGLRLRDPSATQGDASALIEDLLFTDANRVEVLRGSGSSLYGTDAIGGVLNVITDEGGGRTRGNVLVEGGSLGTFRGRALVSGGAGRVQYSLGVMETDITKGVGGDAPYRDAGAQGSVTFHLSPSVRLIARFFGGDSFGKVLGEPAILGSPSGLGIVDAIPAAPALARLYDNGTPISSLNAGNATFIPAPDNPDGTRAARFLDAALRLEGQASPNLAYSVSYQLLTGGRRYGDGPAGAGSYQPGGSTRSLYDGRIQTVNAAAHYRLGRYNLLSGGYELEYETYAYDNSAQADPAVASGANVTEHSHTVFAQDQAQFFGGRLQLSGAVRAQFFTLDAPRFLPLDSAPYQGIGFPAPPPAYTGDGSAAYFFHKTGTKLRMHLGRGYRAPSLYERFGAGFDPVYGYSVYGDPRLRPEHSIGLDAGADQTFWRGRLEASASYFYTSLQNVIGFDTSGIINPATDPYGRFIGYYNTRGGISRGVELSAAVAPVRSLKITTAYTYANAIERSPVVGDVLRAFVIPRNQFSALVTERATSRLLLTGDTLASTNYLAPIYGDYITSFATQTYRFAGIHKVNLGASYRIPLSECQALRLFVRVENIFNQMYIESGFLTAGRTARAGLEFEF